MLFNKMIDIFKFISLFALFVTICLALEKGCRMSQLDEKMKPLTAIVRDVTWPQNEKDMKVICREQPGYISEARSFMKKCIKGEGKTIMSVVIHTMERIFVKSMCKNKRNNDKIKFIASGKCANSGKSTASKCWTKLVGDITNILNGTENKNKFPLLCCCMLKWRDCFINVYEKLGPPDCTTAHIESIDQYLYKSTIDPMNILCGDYDESDKCNKFKNFFSRFQSTKIKQFTPFPSILNLFESL